LIDSYPEVRKVLDLPRLQLCSFAPGAVLANSGRLNVVAHPLKCPWKLLQTLRTAGSWGVFTSILDVLRLGRLVSRWLFKGPYATIEAAATAETTDVFLQRLGLSSSITQQFLRPFFEAIYVSPLTEQSAAMFEFVLRMLAFGGACLPARGMRAVPEQLANGLSRPVQLSTPVDAVTSTTLCVGGEQREHAAVVVAVDAPSAGRLVSLPPLTGTRSVTFYFGLKEPAPVLDPLIILQSYGQESSQPDEGKARVVNIGFPSIVQPSYAPAGHVLAAITIMGPAVLDETWVRSEVQRILGVDCSGWRHLRTYDIAYHQPTQVPLVPPAEVPCEVDGIFCCGDHRADPTLDGAMRSGRRVAEAIIKALRQH